MGYLSNPHHMPGITLSKREQFRYDILMRLIAQAITTAEASTLLRLSPRQTRRLKARVRQFGQSALRHGLAGRPSNRRLPERDRRRLASLLRRHYPDFGPTLAAEKLREQHGLDHDATTIRDLMIAEGLWQPRSKRQAVVHRQWRQRRSHPGELIQFDGSYEYWFEERGDKCCLLLAVDDASGAILYARFTDHEGVFPVFDFWRSYLEKHGKPVSIYLDKFSTYKMTQQTALNNHDLKTQFARAMTELGIEVIFANSPQAKGRVENKFKTLQDRLIKELRLSGINDRQEANEFLVQTFLPTFNGRFARQPRSSENLHRQLTSQEQAQLPRILSKQTERVVHNDWTISFNNQWYQLTKQQPVTVRKGDTIIVEEHPDGAIRFRLRGKYLNAAPIPKRPTSQQGQPWILAASAK